MSSYRPENGRAGAAPGKGPQLFPIVARWAFVAAWACVIVFMSSNTGSNLSGDLGLFSSMYRDLQSIQESLFGPDVDLLSPTAHFCEYALLGFLLSNALRQHVPTGRAFLLAIAYASLFGVTDELHQYFVPERMCDPLDWLVDTCGATLGALVAHLVLPKIEGMRARRP